MEITFFIGNGFDIGLGMPTRYEDFYKSYCTGIDSKGSDTDNITEFKKMLRSRNDKREEQIIDWSDFEKAFGDHSKDLKLERKLDYLARFEDFVENFNKYLEKVENCTDCSNRVEIAKNMNTAVQGYKRIRRDDERAINSVYSKFDNKRVYNFVCFNYTKTLDLCIDAFRESLGKDAYRRIGSVVHIHGFIENNMIIGVNDPSQITDPELSIDEEVIREIVKPKQNEIARSGYENDLHTVINQSHIICVYGMSLGETDAKWWDLISVWLSKSEYRILVILKHEDNYSQRFPYMQDRIIRPLRERFLSFSTLPDDAKQKISDRIYIGINNDVFSMSLFDYEKFKEESESSEINRKDLVMV